MLEQTKLGYYYDDVFLSMTLSEWANALGNILGESDQRGSYDAESTIASIVELNEYLAGVVHKVDMLSVSNAIQTGYNKNQTVQNNTKCISNPRYFYHKGLIILNILKSRAAL